MLPFPSKKARFMVMPVSASNNRSTTVAPSLRASLPHDLLLLLSRIKARFWDPRVVPSWLPGSCLVVVGPDEEVAQTVPWAHRSVRMISASSSPNNNLAALTVRAFLDRATLGARLRVSWPNRYITHSATVRYQTLNLSIDRYSEADRSVATTTAGTLSAAARF